MTTRKNGEYWKKRYEYLENVQNQKAADICKDIEKIYKRAISDCESEIAKWYTRIGDNNGISYSEAKKLLNKNELEEFRWSVEEYIQHGKENAVSKSWTKQLENASAKVHINRLEAMKLQMRHQVELAMAGEAASVEKFIKDVYTDSYYRSVFELQKGLGIGTAFNILDAETVDKIIHKPWAADGLDFSKRIWGKHRPELINRLQTELSHAFIRGDNPKTLIGKIKKEFGVTRSQAENLVLTEAAFFRASGQKKSFENLGVSQYEICATLDNRTSEICQDMDGKKFDVADMQIGVNHPPFHCRCRTTTVPVVEDEFLEGETRAARSVEGDYYRVHGDMKYSDWKQKYVDGSDNVKTAIKNTVKLIGGIIKAVDKSAESGIMSVSNNTMALENQRYGRNKETLINNTYINSGEYRRKFDKLTPNPKVNRVLYSKSKEMLKHRSGTLFEDMYWIDGDTGKVIAREINSNVERQIVYSNSIRKTIASYSGKNILTIHTHPGSMPPSVADFNSCYKNKYACGYIACHNGKLYAYKSEEIIRKSLYDMYTKEAILDGQSEINAQIWAIHKLSQNHKIDFWEVV